ncbi:hypothetical protein phiOC_p318 [Ochrobactrum phage vB_OspM_OC]|nr:hypothetical protein phiOC_p318 [Ochrobactrum phage vB_OspM_OC]
MSDNVLSYGFMAPLLKPISGDDLEDASEYLYDNTDLHMNYEGTLIYSDWGSREHAYGCMVFMSLKDIECFKKEFLKLSDKFAVDFSKAVPYCAYWYDGTDSYMAETTLKEFQEQAGN